MLKVYICPKCGRYRFVTSRNYTCYKCNCDMTLTGIHYENYIEYSEEKRNDIKKKYTTSSS